MKLATPELLAAAVAHVHGGTSDKPSRADRQEAERIFEQLPHAPQSASAEALRDRIRVALEPHWLEYGDHPTGYDKEWAEDIADIVLAALATSAAAGEGDAAPRAYCDGCDGVGWYEGGDALQTQCERCYGTGWADGKP